MAAVGILNAVLPPFQRADDDTLRERIPVALAHPTWRAPYPLQFEARHQWRR